MNFCYICHHNLLLENYIKRAQIQFFWSVFGISVFNLKTGKQGPQETPYLHTFHVVQARKTIYIFRHGAYISHALQMSWYFQCLRINAFLYKQHLCKQHQADILLFENYYMVSASVLSSKNGAYSKERVIKQVCLMLVNLLLPDHRVLLVCHCYLQYTFFLIRKPVFCLSLNFLNIMLEIRLRYS